MNLKARIYRESTEITNQLINTHLIHFTNKNKLSYGLHIIIYFLSKIASHIEIKQIKLSFEY